MRKIKKSELKDFLSKAERMLLDRKYKRTIESDHPGNYEWIKETDFGVLLFYPENCGDSGIYSVFCRFEDPQKAIDILKMFGGNTYSGKCNFHFSEKDVILHNFDRLLSMVG